MKTYLLILTTVLFSFKSIGQQQSNNDCPSQDILFINGKIVTLNEANEIVDAIRIRGNKIIATGEEAKVERKCTKVIDLEGKTVIPGLIDSHIHFIRQGNMPGFEVREAENATSIQSLLDILKNEAEANPNGSILTVMGGISEIQFEEQRMPTKDELDGALPDRPVYIQKGFAGPAVMNNQALKMFRSKGMVIDDSGIISGKQCVQVFKMLQMRQSEEDKQASLQRLMTYANSLGLTTVQDEGGIEMPGASNFDHKNDYDPLISLWKENMLSIRFRVQHVVFDDSEEAGDLEAKLDNTWQGFGDGMLKYTAVGEHIVTFPKDGEINHAYESKVLKAAMDGWPHEQHSVSFQENIQHMEAIKKAHEQFPINELRWSLAHVFEMGGPDTTKYLIADLKQMNMGVKLQNQAYVIKTDKFPLGKSFKSENAGPLYRTLLNSGIPIGAGTDGCLIVPLNPWLSMYYMVTGKDAKGTLVNPNETISRLDALKLYTLGSAWFAFDENDLGSIEVGKKADFVVLNEDFLTVSEEEIKNIRAITTYVNGVKVYEYATEQK